MNLLLSLHTIRLTLRFGADRMLYIAWRAYRRRDPLSIRGRKVAYVFSTLREGSR